MLAYTAEAMVFEWLVMLIYRVGNRLTFDILAVRFRLLLLVALVVCCEVGSKYDIRYSLRNVARMTTQSDAAAELAFESSDLSFSTRFWCVSWLR